MFNMFSVMNVLFPVVFILVFGIILFNLIQIVITWNKNSHSPRLTVPVVIKSWRKNP